MTSSRARRWRARTAVAVTVAAVVGAGIGARALVSRRTVPPAVRDLAETFFSRYQDADGRVVRRDQGSDTVSEGQAYAMLLSVAVDDADRFARVWSWTRRELQRRDGLLSWHWADGKVTDPEPATDADVDAAHALALAADAFGRADYASEARRITEAILREETVVLGGRPYLVAGPWARGRRVANPSYLSPSAFTVFARRFHERQWSELADAGNELVASFGSSPPDWVEFSEDGTARTAAAPGAASSPGLEAARVPIRFAAACEPAVRRLAAPMRVEAGGHPLELVAAAASARAAGERSRSDALLRDAEAAVRTRPSYYGWAWVALGAAMLDGGVLASCR